MDRQTPLSIALLVNVVGAIACVGCWVGDMGWRFVPCAGFFLLGFLSTALSADQVKGSSGGIRHGITDYVLSSFGWHLAVLSALGFGGWKLMVVGLGIGGITLAVLFMDTEDDDDQTAATDPDAVLPEPGPSTFEQELERVQEDMAAAAGSEAAASAPSGGAGIDGSIGDLVELLKISGDPSPDGIDWVNDWERHLPKICTAVLYAGFALRHLHTWPANDDPGSPDHVRWNQRALAIGNLIWEWERVERQQLSCSMLFLTTLSFLKHPALNGEAAYAYALEFSAMEGGLARSTSGRFSVATDLIKLVGAYWEDVLQKLSEDFPMGDGMIDGAAAEDDLAQYMAVRQSAELAVLDFILKAEIDVADIEEERVTGVLDTLHPASREAFVEGWCGAAGYS